jgi:uncharacterized protein
MTSEERDLITKFIERIGGAKPASFGSVPGSIPGAAPALPPIDKEADALIGELFAQYPEARYRLTQTAFVQEQALAEAQNRLKRMEWELEQARQALAQQRQQPAQSQGGGGFLSSIFGGGQSRQPAPPQQWNQGGPQAGAPQAGPWGGQVGGPPAPQYAPGYQPGMLQRSGSGFLGSALTTAAGVAGGMVVGNALMDMFSPHHAGSAGGFLTGGSAEAPWGSPGALPEPPADSPPSDQYVDQGSWTSPDNTAQNDPGVTDPGNWGGGSDQAAWNDPGSDPGADAGWTDDGGSSGGSDDLA